MQSGSGALTKLFVGVFMVLSWILVLARAIPERNGDRGVFVSMAERLAAGDTLYVDVWDNKEPLFFLTLAAGRTVSPFMDVVTEALWIAATALASFAILQTRVSCRWISALVGFSLVPLIITGAIYYAGFTHLPSTALVISGYALLIRGKALWAGGLIPVLVGFKIILVPVALALLVSWFLLERNRRELVRYALGSAAATLILVILLLVRGEFRGFIDLILSNIGYSQSMISDAYAIPIWVHIEPVLQGPAVAVTSVIVFLLAMTRITASRADDLLWWGTLAALLSSMLVIAITGLWPHHGQILYVPAVLAILLACSVLLRQASIGPASAILLIALAIVLSGAPSLRATVDQVLSARGKLMDLARISDATQDLLSVAPSGATYARLGKNTDDSHAQGLRSLGHPCYQFVQYTYDLPATLTRIPECLPSADFVIVDKGLIPEDGAARWNTFVAESETALREHFECAEEPWGRLCTNKNAQRS